MYISLLILYLFLKIFTSIINTIFFAFLFPYYKRKRKPQAIDFLDLLCDIFNNIMEFIFDVLYDSLPDTLRTSFRYFFSIDFVADALFIYFDLIDDLAYNTAKILEKIILLFYDEFKIIYRSYKRHRALMPSYKAA
jgi:hypothetical protein